MITVLNGFNLIDGIDGLAAAAGMLSSLVFGIVFYQEGLWMWALMGVILCGSLAGFAWFNVFGSRNKILMGDTGSLLCGFILALLTVRFLDLENPAVWKWELQSPMAFALAVLIVPVFDTLRIIIIRLFRGQSPLHPDRRHIHYRMTDAGLTHLQTTGILVGINATMIILSLVLQRVGEIKLILLLLILSSGLSVLPGYYIRKRKQITKPGSLR
jgi:UDP-N-acetylmuramyl pentapeptide phosphotransferase/UDP-N-acetylglucosamine-1-phosphate transferase